MKRSWRLAWLAVLAGPTPAFAHSPVPGFEGVYVGLIHPFSTPSQALLMIGSSLLVGGFSTERARWLLLGFLIASLVGLAVGPRIPDIDPYLFALAFVACAFAALVPGRLMLLAIASLSFGGFLIGQVSIPDDGPTRDRLFTMLGSMIGANVGLLYLFGIYLVIRERFTWPWVGVAFRVVAAWLGAIASLMLALRYAQVVVPV